MIISVASGKGGTGKTTISVNMALALGIGVELFDCDVEEPNAHLFLKPKIERSEQVDVAGPVGRSGKMHFLSQMFGYLPVQRFGCGQKQSACFPGTLP